MGKRSSGQTAVLDHVNGAAHRLFLKNRSERTALLQDCSPKSSRAAVLLAAPCRALKPRRPHLRRLFRKTGNRAGRLVFFFANIASSKKLGQGMRRIGSIRNQDAKRRFGTMTPKTKKNGNAARVSERFSGKLGGVMAGAETARLHFQKRGFFRRATLARMGTARMEAAP